MNRILAMLCQLLVVATGPPVANAALLAVDVDDRTAIDALPLENTVPGFQSYIMTGTTAALGTSTNTVGGYTITLNAVNSAGTAAGNFDDRDRANPTNTPALAQIYDDFIFGGATSGEGGGIDVLIDSGGALAANSLYRFALYSFDEGSITLPRTANWLDGNNSDALVLSTSFSGGAANLPVNDDDYKFQGTVMTDAQGNLSLKGRNTTPVTTTVNPGVFINGFEISQIPEPNTLALAALVLSIATWKRRRTQ